MRKIKEVLRLPWEAGLSHRHLAATLCLAAALLTAAMCSAGAETLNEMLGYAPEQKLLIINGDDAGMCHSANLGIIDCMENGLMTSATMMVPCPWFPEIASYARERPERDFGIHITHTSEWQDYRWGPVAGKAAVPGLVDEEGYLWRDSAQVWTHASPEEAEHEARAQIERALALGIDVTHIDSHMGAMQLDPRFLERYVKLAAEYDLPLRGGPRGIMAGVPAFARAKELGVLSPDDLIHGSRQEGEAVDAYWKRILGGLGPGVTELYLHASLGTEESRAITDTWHERAEEHRLFTTDPEVRQIIRDQGIVLIGYRQLRDLQRERRKTVSAAPRSVPGAGASPIAGVDPPQHCADVK